MKTFSSFLPRLGEHGYIHVSTAELCQSIIADEAEQGRFVKLRQIMQQCRDLLRAFRRKSEGMAERMQRPVLMPRMVQPGNLMELPAGAHDATETDTRCVAQGDVPRGGVRYRPPCRYMSPLSPCRVTRLPLVCFLSPSNEVDNPRLPYENNKRSDSLAGHRPAKGR